MNKITALYFVLAFSIAPSFVFADTATTSSSTSTPLTARISLIQQYLGRVGCPVSSTTCAAIAGAIAREEGTTTISSATSSSALAALASLPIVFATKTSAAPRVSEQTLKTTKKTAAAPAAIPIVAPSQIRVGNALLQNLPALFVLNALFANHGNGLLTPGPASLGNIIILYQIFFSLTY